MGPVGVQFIQDFVTPWTVAHQAPLPTRFPRQEYWSEVPFLPPGDPSNPGMEPVSPASSSLAGGFFTTTASGNPYSTGNSTQYSVMTDMGKESKKSVCTHTHTHTHTHVCNTAL